MTLEEKALTEAHREYERQLCTYSFFKVHNWALADDMVQDTFLKTWKYLLKGGKIDLMRAFLYHILNDIIIDEYRKRKTYSLEALAENGFEPSTGGAEAFCDVIDGKSLAALVKRLPEKYRSAVAMRYIDELTLAEMANASGLSKNTMAVHVNRGLKKLKILYTTQTAQAV